MFKVKALEEFQRLLSSLQYLLQGEINKKKAESKQIEQQQAKLTKMKEFIEIHFNEEVLV